MIKIKTYRISRKGIRGATVTLPITWLRDVDAHPGDLLDVYRDQLDRLIILPPQHNTSKKGRAGGTAKDCA